MWQKKENSSFELSPLSPLPKMQGKSYSGWSPQGTDVPCRDVCVSTSAVQLQVFLILYTDIQTIQSIFIRCRMNQDSSCCQSFWEHVICDRFSQEPVVCTAPPEVFSHAGAVSLTHWVTERQEKPHPVLNDGSIRNARCANRGSGASVQKWVHQI